MPEEAEDWVLKAMRENRPQGSVLPSEPTGPDLNVGETRRSLGVPAPSDKTFRGDFVSRNFQGVPIDLDRQLSTDYKTKLLMRERPEDKVSFLEQEYGKGNVRLADDGTPLVLAKDAKGNPVEFRPLGEGRGGVVANVQALLPEIAGSVVGMAAGKRFAGSSKNRPLKFASEMIGTALGEQSAGAVKDIAVSDQPVGEIVAERFGKRLPESAALNAAMGGATALAGKLGGRLISPFGGTTGEVEQGAEEAVRYFKDKFGIDYPLTPGEKIGSRLFKRVEATMSRNPGSSKAFDKMERQKVEALRQIQAKMLSSKLDPADVGMLRKLEEEVGEDAITAVRQSMQPLQRAEDMARSNAIQASHQALMDDLAKATGPARQLYPQQVGASMRAGAASRRMAFETEADRLYNKAYSLPGGTQKVLEPPSLVSDAQRLLREQPSAATAKPSAIVGPTGQPLISTQAGEEALTAFYPEGIKPMLESLASLDRPKFALQDLVKMRTEVRNGIKRGEAVPGVSTHYLGEVEKTLTKAIDEGTARLPNQELRNAWKEANDFYAKNVGQFKDKNVAKFFKDEQTGAFVQDEDLVRNIGPSEYAAYKKFFGESSPEFTSLKRALIDGLVPKEGVIEAKSFLRNLDNFLEKNTSVAQDILGPQIEGRLRGIGKKLQELQAGDVVERDDIINMLVSGGKNNMVAKLDELVQAQRQLNTAYRSQIVKDIATGKLGQSFDAGEFVSRLWDTASVGEIKAIKGQLADNPQVLQDLERKVAERIFSKAQRAASPSEAARLGIGTPFSSAKASSLEGVFGSEENKKRLAELIGPERMGDFEQLAKLLRGGELSEKAFAAAGGFSQQNQIQHMLRGGVLGYMADWMRQKVVATIYFIPQVRELLINQVGRSPEAQANLVRTAVLSQPFMNAMADDFGDKSSTVIDKILDGLDLYQARGKPGAKNEADWVERVMQEAKRSNPARPRVMPIQ